jgi:hypothetical protein
MAGFSAFAVSFAGGNASSGPIALSVPEVKAGDLRVHLSRDGDPINEVTAGIFAIVVTTDGEITQSHGDSTGANYTAVFLRFM